MESNASSSSSAGLHALDSSIGTLVELEKLGSKLQLSLQVLEMEKYANKVLRRLANPITFLLPLEAYYLKYQTTLTVGVRD